MYDPIIIRTGNQTPLLEALRHANRQQGEILGQWLPPLADDLARLVTLLEGGSLSSVDLTALHGEFARIAERLKTLLDRLEVKS